MRTSLLKILASNKRKITSVELLNISFNDQAHDLKAAIKSYEDLKSIFPDRQIRLILVKGNLSVTDQQKSDILDILHPMDTEMDFNISLALKIASSGQGTDFETNDFISCNSKVLLNGLGADELFCGYSRYRVAYIRGGYSEVQEEMYLDQQRLWIRNLGRDDRIVSSEHKEMRTPFLYHELWHFVNSISVELNAVMTTVNGKNIWTNKLALRELANRLGMFSCANLSKKAIQFGTGIAKESNIKKYGSNRKGKGTDVLSLNN